MNPKKPECAEIRAEGILGIHSGIEKRENQNL